MTLFQKDDAFETLICGRSCKTCTSTDGKKVVPNPQAAKNQVRGDAVKRNARAPPTVNVRTVHSRHRRSQTSSVFEQYYFVVFDENFIIFSVFVTIIIQ